MKEWELPIGIIQETLDKAERLHTSKENLYSEIGYLAQLHLLDYLSQRDMSEEDFEELPIEIEGKLYKGHT